MTPLRKVAFKNGSLAGLIFTAGLALASCVGAAAPAEPSKNKESSMPTAISVTVPDAGWSLRVDRVVELDQEVWVLAQLRRGSGMAAQMISQAKAEIPVTLPEKRLRVFVAGKTWKWTNDETYEFVASLEDVTRQAGAARGLFPAPAKQGR